MGGWCGIRRPSHPRCRDDRGRRHGRRDAAQALDPEVGGRVISRSGTRAALPDRRPDEGLPGRIHFRTGLTER